MDKSELVGRTLLHYRVIEKIGEGGMGAVYKAVDTHLDRAVAVKVLPPDKVADPERKQRFVQEAKAASALRHPNIVVIHDIAADGGRDFMVMEFIEGQSLDVLVGRKGLKLNEALGYAVQIADGLAKAHAAGIVHRDLKPTNIMITPDGLVKILDFGLAKLTEDLPGAEPGRTITLGHEEKPRTEAGFIVGTAAYMSPEQAEGKKVDARSDIFSFGTVLYEMLTGRRAFGRDSRIKTLAAVLNEEPPPSSAINESVPAELERVLGRCLRKDPQRRWQNMSDLKVALQDLKEDSESGKLEAAAALGRRGKNKIVPLVAAVVILIAAAAIVFRLVGRKPEAPLGFEITPLTFDDGLTAFPTLSADGNIMAYGSDREGGRNGDIWVQQVSGGRPLRLTYHPADDWFPSFSPDGSQIAFRSERDGGGIYLVDALGGEPRLIAEKGATPKFSPDGRFISFVVVPASLEARLYRMYLISPKGGEPRPVLDGFILGYANQGASPVWSPDGKYLIFRGRRVDDPKSTDWWVAPVDGGEPVRTHAIENLDFMTFVLYPVGWAGRYVYFTSGTTIEGMNLSRVAIDAKDWRVKGPAEPITTGPGIKAYVSVMRDGRVFFTDMTAVMGIWSVAARPDEAAVGADPQRLTQDLMQKFYPSISRDGAKAAFTAFGGAQASKIEIRLKDLRTGQETTIPLRNVGLGQYTRLSPDGSLLAFRDTVEGKTRSYVLARGAAAARELCEGCFVLGFFPGNDAALVRIRPNELEKMDLRTGTRAIVLSAAPDFVGDGSLSPDGEWIAWIAGEPDGRAAIRIAPVGTPAGAAPAPVTVAEAGYYLGAPAWSPNGRWLYFLSEKWGRTALMALELDPRTKKPAGAERQVYTPTESRFMLNMPRGNGAISVAADRIIFTVSEITANIYLAKPKKR